VTPIWPVDPLQPADPPVRAAAEVLRGGGLVAFPTETVYGLGANALDETAVKKIFRAKGRPATNPVIVHVARPEDVRPIAAAWPAVAAELAAAFWPGPLTLVLPKGSAVPAVVTAGGPTVAVRCPAHAVARALIRAAGVPLAAPSANRSTELSPTRAEHVSKSLGDRIDGILDGGPCPGGLESTVVDVTAGVRILRPGLVTSTMLEAVVGPLAAGGGGDGVAKSPGLMAKHYSPRTPVVLTHGERGNEGGRVFRLKLGDDPAAAAAALYATLHELDAAGYDRIEVEMPPDVPAWAAVRDRLTRAATI
jgi:L-threonylcarbamoyladenylate synthase